ncbi:MAG: UbiA family prenyltransferase [Candidatus Bathyarchaeota archaeon]|nr:UbiA family prenyltransferase [Candidatus Bathyarchaeota archaeon]
MAKKTLEIVETEITPFPARALNKFSNLLKLLTSTSIFLAINGLIVTAFSTMLYELEVRPVILSIAFLATFSVYNMNKATDKAEDSINRPETASRGTLFFLVPSIAAMVMCLLLSASIGVEVFSIMAASFVLSILYSVKLAESLPRLKEIVGVKSVLVALSWGFTGSLLPAISQPVDAVKVFLAFAFIFIQLLVNTILCDIPDMDGDRASGVRTLPIVLGLDATRKLLLFINSLMLPWLFYCLVTGLFLEYMPALFFGMVYGYLIIWGFSRKKCKRLLVEIAVDGEWIPLIAFMKLL